MNPGEGTTLGEKHSALKRMIAVLRLWVRREEAWPPITPPSPLTPAAAPPPPPHAPPLPTPAATCVAPAAQS